MYYTCNVTSRYNTLILVSGIFSSFFLNGTRIRVCNTTPPAAEMIHGKYIYIFIHDIIVKKKLNVFLAPWHTATGIYLRALQTRQARSG